MGDVLVKEVATRKDLREFIYLPEKVHKDDSNWLPPIYIDEWELFDKKKNKSYQYADTVLYLAYRGNQPVGRIMGIINRRYNEINKEYHGRFCFMECYEDQEVFHALISRVEEWARQKGMVKLVGPLGFSDKDPQGFQIEGFEYPKFIVAATNLSYMPQMLELEGYEKKVDLVNYKVRIPEELPVIYKKVLSRVSNNKEFKILEFSAKKELRPYIIPALDLMNESFMEIYGFVPLTDKEKKDLADRYMMIIDPRFVKLVVAKEEVVGFAVGIPDMSPGIQAARGRMFPFGFLRILSEAKRTKNLLMMLGGVRKSFRGQGIDVLMAVKILESSIKSQMETIDVHLVLETNTRMRAECERVDGRILKKWRIYEKPL
jgi:GNAT superfamily N-acetyltransferase